jgi:hypothetical protein
MKTEKITEKTVNEIGDNIINKKTGVTYAISEVAYIDTMRIFIVKGENLPSPTEPAEDFFISEKDLIESYEKIIG